MLAGALLAFALSFDEVIVTTFTAGADQTLPIWILANLSRPNQLPVVNVVALAVRGKDGAKAGGDGDDDGKGGGGDFSGVIPSTFESSVRSVVLELDRHL